MLFAPTFFPDNLLMCVADDLAPRHGGGRPGPLTSIGLGLNDARRPFRIYKPVESMLPLVKVG